MQLRFLSMYQNDFLEQLTRHEFSNVGMLPFSQKQKSPAEAGLFACIRLVCLNDKP